MSCRKILHSVILVLHLLISGLVVAVLVWRTALESVDNISYTLKALTTEIDMGIMFEGLDPGHKHSLVSMVSFHLL